MANKRRLNSMGMIPQQPPICRRSSEVEHTIGNGEVESSILSGGTTIFL